MSKSQFLQSQKLIRPENLKFVIEPEFYTGTLPNSNIANFALGFGMVYHIPLHSNYGIDVNIAYNTLMGSMIGNGDMSFDNLSLGVKFEYRLFEKYFESKDIVINQEPKVIEPKVLLKTDTLIVSDTISLFSSTIDKESVKFDSTTSRIIINNPNSENRKEVYEIINHFTKLLPKPKAIISGYLEISISDELGQKHNSPNFIVSEELVERNYFELQGLLDMKSALLVKKDYDTLDKSIYPIFDLKCDIYAEAGLAKAVVEIYSEDKLLLSLPIENELRWEPFIMLKREFIYLPSLSFKLKVSDIEGTTDYVDESSINLNFERKSKLAKYKEEYYFFNCQFLDNLTNKFPLDKAEVYMPCLDNGQTIPNLDPKLIKAKQAELRDFTPYINAGFSHEQYMLIKRVVK